MAEVGQNPTCSRSPESAGLCPHSDTSNGTKFHHNAPPAAGFWAQSLQDSSRSTELYPPTTDAGTPTHAGGCTTGQGRPLLTPAAMTNLHSHTYSPRLELVCSLCSMQTHGRECEYTERARKMLQDKKKKKYCHVPKEAEGLWLERAR